MITFPPAKINIGLNITERRPDGYHNLETVFYPTGYCDVLEIIPSVDPSPSLSFSGISLPGTDKDNLCVKAIELLSRDFRFPVVRIHLHKNIPPGAGLGGGSADAAYTLKCLSELFNLNLSSETLEEYARQLGSDCAFFIRNTPVFAFEKGDCFETLPIRLENYLICISIPPLHIGTAEAYAGVTPSPPRHPLKKLIALPPEEWKSLIVNDFEQSVFLKYPELKNLKEKHYASGAVYASMSGSGSSVYGIYRKDGTPGDLRRKLSSLSANCKIYCGQL